MRQWLRAVIEYNAIARLTMVASIAMSWRCAEWFMNLEDPTMQQSAFVSVIMGVTRSYMSYILVREFMRAESTFKFKFSFY